MSGQFVISVAGSFPEKVKATASLYGTRMVTDAADSPHLLIPKIQGEVYLGFAAHDPYVEDHVPATLKDALEKNNVTFELETFDDTEHGFCFPARPAYNKQAAEHVWDNVFAMFARQLAPH
jgi:carboxymethylenebutenolidase